METIEREFVSLNRQLNSLEKDLKEKKKKYEASVQYLYKNKSIEEKLMFIFSAKNLGQTSAGRGNIKEAGADTEEKSRTSASESRQRGTAKRT